MKLFFLSNDGVMTFGFRLCFGLKSLFQFAVQDTGC